MSEQDNRQDSNCCEDYQDVSTPQEERLQYECEQAFLRLQFEEPSGAEEWKKFSSRVRQEKKKSRKLRSFILFSASVAALLIAVFLLWSNVETTLHEKQVAVLVKTEPVKQASVIEEDISSEEKTETPLPNISKARIEKEGVVLSATEADYTRASVEKVCRNIVSIPRGQVYKIVLSDGTEVWMNASSRLSFPTRFSGSRRTVTLEGEAYFKVARDEQHPFVIITDKMTTEVLGTEFNVKAYKDSEAHVTLVQGSVKVHLPGIDREVLLVPGDDITCTDDDFQVHQVNVSYYTYWMEGYFYYDNVHLSDILKDLGRWYNVTIEMEQDSLLEEQRLHFVADRSETIDSVIENLNLYQYLSVIKDGENKITVRKRE